MKRKKVKMKMDKETRQALNNINGRVDLLRQHLENWIKSQESDGIGEMPNEQELEAEYDKVCSEIEDIVRSNQSLSSQGHLRTLGKALRDLFHGMRANPSENGRDIARSTLDNYRNLFSMDVSLSDMNHEIHSGFPNQN